MSAEESTVTMCLQHAHMALDFFCGSHDQLCCKECIEGDHNDCQDVKSVADMVQDTDHSVDYRKFQEDVNEIKQISTEINSNLNERELMVREGLTSEKDKLEQLRADINALFDNMVSNVEDRESEATANDSNNIEKISLETDHVINEIESIENKAENLKRSKKDRELFIWIRKAKPKLRLLENKLDTLVKESNPRGLLDKAKLPEVKGGTELNLIQIEEACIQFKLMLSKCVLVNDNL